MIDKPLKLLTLAVFIAVILIWLFGCNTAFAQDSTFSHYQKVQIIDSVIFEGNQKMSPDYFGHFSKIGYWDHNWVVRGEYRICLSCLRWEKFHTQEIAVYTYDIYWITTQKALKIMEKK